MRPRFDILRDCRDSLEAVLSLDRFIDFAGLNDGLVILVNLRISQLEASPTSTAHHTKRATAMGKSEQWIASIARWRKSSVYNPVEQALLEFTEYIATNRGEVSDVAYDSLRHFFFPSDIAKIMVAIAAARLWCHFSHLARSDPHTVVEAATPVDKYSLPPKNGFP